MKPIPALKLKSNKYERLADLRSSIMRQVKSKDTSPEKRVRSLLHDMGLRFRLHSKQLIGHPDLIFPGKKVALFVHGCFWHRHQGCKRATMPQTNLAYWSSKFERNIRRDIKVLSELKRLGWKVEVLWECETKDSRKIKDLGRRIASHEHKDGSISTISHI